jgi:hypothetical protein
MSTLNQKTKNPTTNRTKKRSSSITICNISQDKKQDKLDKTQLRYYIFSLPKLEEWLLMWNGNKMVINDNVRRYKDAIDEIYFSGYTINSNPDKLSVETNITAKKKYTVEWFVSWVRNINNLITSEYNLLDRIVLIPTGYAVYYYESDKKTVSMGKFNNLVNPLPEKIVATEIIKIKSQLLRISIPNNQEKLELLSTLLTQETIDTYLLKLGDVNPKPKPKPKPAADGTEIPKLPFLVTNPDSNHINNITYKQAKSEEKARKSTSLQKAKPVRGTRTSIKQAKPEEKARTSIKQAKPEEKARTSIKQAKPEEKARTSSQKDEPVRGTRTSIKQAKPVRGTRKSTAIQQANTVKYGSKLPLPRVVNKNKTQKK